MRKRQPRHRLYRISRRPLLGTVLIALPVMAAVGVMTLTPTAPTSPAPAQAAATQAKVEAPRRDAANPTCTLTVPPDPLSAKGLARPYELSGSGGNGACHESDADQSAFVEAAILDPATGTVSLYHPLVIDRGTRPAVAPVTPALPAHAVVGIWFGFNGDTLTLRGNGSSLAEGSCVNGSRGSPFGQFAYCHAPAFFAAAGKAVHAKQLRIPALGNGTDGRPCPTVRDFSVVDQDQSDNVNTTYLVLPDGRTAQDTAANARRVHHATTLANGSDNRLLDASIDPALGCHPFTAHDLTNGGAAAPGLALNELQAAALQRAPIALAPLNDPMTLVDGAANVAKTNLYRTGVDQPAIDPATETPNRYCAQLRQVGGRRIAADRRQFRAAPSPEPDTANLYEFLTQRLKGSLEMLNCPGN